MKISRRLSVSAAAAASAALMLAPKVASALDTAWAGANPFGNNFTDPLCWQAFFVPGPGDRAIFSTAPAASSPVFGSGTITVNQLVISARLLDETYQPGNFWRFVGVASNENLNVSSDVTIVEAFAGTGAKLGTFGLDVYTPNTFIGDNSGLFVTGSSTYTSRLNTVGNGTFSVDSGNTIRGIIDHNSSSYADVYGLLDASGFQVRGGGYLAIKPTGNLFIQQNSFVTNGTLYLDPGAQMSMTNGSVLQVSGSNAMVSITDSFAWPNNTKLSLSNGGHVGANSYIDLGNGNTGSMTVDGSGSWIGATNTSDWGLGAAGAATVVFSNSGVGTYDTLRMGRSTGSADVRLLTGGQLTTLTSLEMGSAGSHGTLSLAVSGGMLNVNGTATFSNAALVTLNNASGAINFNGDGTFAAGSTLNWSSGALSIASGKTLNIAGGVVNKTGGTSSIGNGATLRITNGGKFTTNSFHDIANGAATGTLIVDGANSFFNSTAGLTDYGKSTGNFATVSFSNGGVGTYATGLQMAANGGKAVVTLSSNGQLSTGNLSAGSSVAGSAATINIAGGTLSNSAGASFFGGAVVNLTSGGLVLAGNGTFNTGATFNWTGGNLGLTSGKTLAFVGGVGTITNGFGLPDGVTLRVTNAGQLTSNYIDVGSTDTGGANGTLVIDGANSKLTSNGLYTDWGLNNGNTATVTISNSGAGTYNADLHIAANGGKALVNLQSNGALNASFLQVGGLAAGTSATISVNGGTLRTTGGTNINGGSTLSYAAGTVSIAGALTTNDDGRVLLTTGGNKVLKVGGLTTLGNSKVDLSDNDMIVGSLMSKSAVENMIRTARNGGAWNTTTGLTSSAAASNAGHTTGLGVLLGDEYTGAGGAGIFDGQTYSPSDKLVKYTWNGDANFDGRITFDDYVKIDTGFNTQRTGWFNGDFNYSGSVNFDDYVLIDIAFNQQSGTLDRAIDWISGDDRSATGIDQAGLGEVIGHFGQFGASYGTAFLAAVPEPGAIGFGALAAGGLLGRRLRRHACR